MHLVKVILAFAEPEKPLPAGNPALVLTDAANPGISKCCPLLGQQGLFCAANHAQTTRIDLPDEERGTMTEDMVIPGSTARVNQKETFSDPRPVLLSVVTAQGLSVIKSPLTNLLKNQAIPAARYITTVIRP